MPSHFILNLGVLLVCAGIAGLPVEGACRKTQRLDEEIKRLEREVERTRREVERRETQRRMRQDERR